MENQTQTKTQENPDRISRLVIVVNTPADWGMLAPIAVRLRDDAGIHVSVIATHIDHDPKCTSVAQDVTSQGFELAEDITLKAQENTPTSKAVMIGECLSLSAKVLGKVEPQAILVFGARPEALAISFAATIMHIPVIHIGGGETSQNPIEDSIRNSITKLASLHFTATDPFRMRLIQMGEMTETVINSGSVGVYNLKNHKPIPKEELEQQIGFEFSDKALLLTFHPQDTETPENAKNQCNELITALNRFPSTKLLITYPNSDSGHSEIISLWEELAANNPQRVTLVKNLSHDQYHSALAYVKAVVGNSYTGVVVVPSMRIPTVNIGDRQKGKMVATSVINCRPIADEIYRALNYALSEKGQETAAVTQNPYYKPKTLQIIVDTIKNASLKKLHNKKFYTIQSLYNSTNDQNSFYIEL